MYSVCMSKWIFDIAHETVVALIAGAIVTAIVAAWGRIKDRWSWPMMTVYALVVFACTLFIFDRFAGSSGNQAEPKQKSEQGITEQNIEAKTRAWLDAFHLGVTKLADSPDFYFSFQAIGNNKIPITIVRSKEHEHYLTLLGKIEISPKHRALFEKLSEGEKIRLIQKLRIEVAQSQINCAFDPPNTFNFVVIEKRIPITGSLTEAQFMQGAEEMNYGIILVRDTLGLILDNKDNSKPPS
jgi:hypothetical protein